MKKFNKAFTLTELIVALGVIAILCAILVPVVFNMMPNQNIIMAKKAFYTAQTIVSDMINDPRCYPDKTSTEDGYVGFDDPTAYSDCPTETSTGNAAKKFIVIFFDKLGIQRADRPHTVGEWKNTPDGICWSYSADTSFTKSGSTISPITLYIDVDSKNNVGTTGNPCGANSTSTGHNGETAVANFMDSTTSSDTFRIEIDADGGMRILDSWAQNATSLTKNITD